VVRVTERTRHAAELAGRAVADGCELVVAVGGDGTMNEIAGALVGTPAVLGLIPCGSGDGLGRHLGIHGKLGHVFDVLRRGQPRWIDSGAADGHPFFSVAGVGFEAEVAERFNRQTHRGFTGYLRIGTLAWFRHQPADYMLEHDGRTEHFRATTIAIANSRQYGNNAFISPTAEVDDGLLDLVAIPPASICRLADLCRRLVNGTLTESPHVIFRRGARFRLHRPAGGPVQTDGEVFAGGRSVEFAVHPASLRVMCPARSR
jgi:YegS/Rv2252/BmrU family lipid kinase